MDPSKLPSFPKLLASLAVCALHGATGCTVPNGADGKASFSYEMGGETSNHPLALGAKAHIDVTVPSGVAVDHASSSDPTVFSVGVISPFGGAYAVLVSGMKAGAATLTVYDADDKVIDLTTVEVEPTASLQPSVASGLTALAYELQSFSVTANDATGAALAGGGAVELAERGQIDASIDPFDDNFVTLHTGGPGDEQLNMSAESATSSLLLHVVPLSAIDSFTFASPSLTLGLYDDRVIPYTLSAAGVKVCSDGTEVTCTSSAPHVAIATNFGGSGLSATGATGQVTVEGLDHGRATITCSIEGRQASFEVTVTE